MVHAEIEKVRNGDSLSIFLYPPIGRVLKNPSLFAGSQGEKPEEFLPAGTASPYIKDRTVLPVVKKANKDEPKKPMNPNNPNILAKAAKEVDP